MLPRNVYLYTYIFGISQGVHCVLQCAASLNRDSDVWRLMSRTFLRLQSQNAGTGIIFPVCRRTTCYLSAVLIAPSRVESQCKTPGGVGSQKQNCWEVLLQSVGMSVATPHANPVGEGSWQDRRAVPLFPQPLWDFIFLLHIRMYFPLLVQSCFFSPCRALVLES